MKNRPQDQVRPDHNPNSNSLQGQTKQRKTPAKRQISHTGNFPTEAAARPPAPPPAGAGQGNEHVAPKRLGWPYDYSEMGFKALAGMADWTDQRAIVHMAAALRNCYKEIRLFVLPDIKDRGLALEIAEVLLMAIHIDMAQTKVTANSGPVWDASIAGIADSLAWPVSIDDKSLLVYIALAISQHHEAFCALLPRLGLHEASLFAEALVIAEFITDCEGIVTERESSKTSSIQILAYEMREAYFIKLLEDVERYDATV